MQRLVLCHHQFVRERGSEYLPRPHVRWKRRHALQVEAHDVLWRDQVRSGETSAGIKRQKTKQRKGLKLALQQVKPIATTEAVKSCVG